MLLSATKNLASRRIAKGAAAPVTMKIVTQEKQNDDGYIWILAILWHAFVLGRFSSAAVANHQQGRLFRRMGFDIADPLHQHHRALDFRFCQVAERTRPSWRRSAVRESIANRPANMVVILAVAGGNVMSIVQAPPARLSFVGRKALRFSAHF